MCIRDRFKSLRRKFVASAVVSVAVVITLMAVTLNFINYYKLEQRIDETLYETAKSQTLVALFKEGAENDLVITKNTSSATDSTGFSVAKMCIRDSYYWSSPKLHSYRNSITCSNRSYIYFPNSIYVKRSSRCSCSCSISIL